VLLGPRREIHIIDPNDVDDKLGAALMRFPEVRELEVTVQLAETPGREAWTQLCARLRTLPHLQKLELGGTGLTDEAMAQFANHPRSCVAPPSSKVASLPRSRKPSPRFPGLRT
jgi:hypothetical protein